MYCGLIHKSFNTSNGGERLNEGTKAVNDLPSNTHPEWMDTAVAPLHPNLGNSPRHLDTKSENHNRPSYVDEDVD